MQVYLQVHFDAYVSQTHMYMYKGINKKDDKRSFFQKNQNFKILCFINYC